MSNAPSSHKESLKKAGLRATPARMQMLEALESAAVPLTILELLGRMKPCPDQTTLYRSLEACAEKGLVSRIDFQHGHVHYEISLHHHHHVVCKGCGFVEDVESCDVDAILNALLRRSKRFKSPLTHSLEFFGHCTKCEAL